MEAPDRLTPGSSDTGRPLARGADTANTEGRRTIDRASDALHPAVDRIAAGAHQAIDKVADVATQAAQSLGERGEQLKGAQTRALDAARDYVQAHPLAALGIALGTGYLLSRLLHSR
jgi:ElaB/YqjD/DUF883 family membrane-anchored ribosome-binding protein